MSTDFKFVLSIGWRMSCLEKWKAGFGFLTDALKTASSPCRVERLWTGGRWLEEPAWFAARTLSAVFGYSQQSHDAVRRDQRTGLRLPLAINNSSSSTIDNPGSPCNLRAPDAARDPDNFDGSTCVLADGSRERLNSRTMSSSNRMGSIWFTDPSWHRRYRRLRRPEIGGCHVYKA